MGKKMRVRRGKCRVCGCTDAKACMLTHVNACAWADKAHTICTRHGQHSIVKRARESGEEQEA